ncbi:MAG TPA: hypothetical protein VJZ71_05540 [Phycisphaerae bacterium]|nr:hypothetical protein [Phycisphaerae bacterium]
MTVRGHIRNGQIAFDEPLNLPEGAEVYVEVVGNGQHHVVRSRRARRISLDPELARQIASMPDFQPEES